METDLNENKADINSNDISPTNETPIEKSPLTCEIIENSNGRFTSKLNLRLIRLPKQDFKSSKNYGRIPYSLENSLKEVFNLFCEDDKVNPYDIKNGLRKVSKKLYVITRLPQKLTPYL